jgi:hypothetical protein
LSSFQVFLLSFQVFLVVVPGSFLFVVVVSGFPVVVPGHHLQRSRRMSDTEPFDLSDTEVAHLASASRVAGHSQGPSSLAGRSQPALADRGQASTSAAAPAATLLDICGSPLNWSDSSAASDATSNAEEENNQPDRSAARLDALLAMAADSNNPWVPAEHTADWESGGEEDQSSDGSHSFIG